MDFLLHYSGSAKAFAIYHYSCCRLNPEILLSMLPESILPIGLNCPGIPIRGIGFGSDSNAMVETAMNYLYSHNCRRIVYLGLTAKPWFYSRFETYRRMQADHGVEISSDLLLTRFPDLSKRGRNDLLTHLETARIDGIFAPEAKWMRQLYQILPETLREKICFAAIGESAIPDRHFMLVRPDFVEQGRNAIRLLRKMKGSRFGHPRYFPVPFLINENG